MEMSNCPEYIRCSAALCPLDSAWKNRVHAEGDKICRIMREHVKAGADSRFADLPLLAEARPAVQLMLDTLYQLKEEAGQGNMARGFGAVLRQVEAAKMAGSSFDKNKASGERLHAARAA